MASYLVRITNNCRFYFVVCAFVLLVLFYALLSCGVGFQEEASPEDEIRDELTKHLSHELGTACDSTGLCMKILQEYHVSSSGKISGLRMLVLKDHENMALSVMDLIEPKNLTRMHLNPRNWKVDHSTLVSPVYELQAGAGFFMESLSLTAPEIQKVLVLGLGGGSTSSFLVQLPLNVNVDAVELENSMYNVATEYFDLPVSPKLHVFIQDGIEYMDEAVRKGVIYQSILLDACANNANLTVMCPAPSFLEGGPVRALSLLVGMKGVLSVNVFTPRYNERTYQEVLAIFAKHFRSCFYLSGEVGSKTMFCSNKKNWDYEHQRNRFLKNMEEFDNFAHTYLALTVEEHNK